MLTETMNRTAVRSTTAEKINSYNVMVNLFDATNLYNAGGRCRLWSNEPKERTGDDMNPRRNTHKKI